MARRRAFIETAGVIVKDEAEARGVGVDISISVKGELEASSAKRAFLLGLGVWLLPDGVAMT